MNIKEYFETHKKAAIAFSGGVDSAYLLYEAVKCGCHAKAYYVKTEFQPMFELEDARRFANELSADMTIINHSVLADRKITENPPNRCYYCKKQILSCIAEEALKDGFDIILDGTNASDDAIDRPGMKALQELKILSPLRECGITKDEVRGRSKEAGLFTWNKPAYSCLATRITCRQEITALKLEKTETAEAAMSELGFRDFRVRMDGITAKIQVKKDQMGLLFEKREEVLNRVAELYDHVVLDLMAR